MKKVISLLLAAVLLLALAGCGGGGSNGGSSGTQETAPVNGSGGLVFRGSNGSTVGTPETNLTAQQIYDSIDYIPEMFYGNYVFGGGNGMLSDQEEQHYLEQAGTCRVDLASIGMADAESLSAVPLQIVAGKENLNHILSSIEGRNVACLTFMKNGEYLDFVYADYEISGSQIIFTPFLNWEYNDQTRHLTYEMAEGRLVYDFSFRGPTLTLSTVGASVTLSAMDPQDNFHFLGILDDGYLKGDSVSISGLERIGFGTHNWNVYAEQAGKNIDDIAAELRKDGLLTLTWTDPDEVVHTRQLVYFTCAFNGYVFADLDGIYCYTTSFSDYCTNQLRDNISDGEVDALENLSDAQVEALVQKKADLVADLAAAYAASGLGVTVNARTGEIALDSGVLFDVNESTVSPEGREFLKQFIGVYTSVVFNEKYAGFISQIMVEGHTDTNGAYDMNLELSQRRADSVKDYCLSAECGITGDTLAALERTVSAVGYSYDRPVCDEDGNVDMDASRRVSFRLLIHLTGE